MAAATIRHYNIFVDSVKQGEFNASTYTYNSGNEDAFGASGWLGTTTGARTTTLKFDTIVTTTSTASKTLKAALKAGKYVQIALAGLGPETETVEMSVISAEFTTDTKTGELKGSFELHGGDPSSS